MKNKNRGFSISHSGKIDKVNKSFSDKGLHRYTSLGFADGAYIDTPCDVPFEWVGREVKVFEHGDSFLGRLFWCKFYSVDARDNSGRRLSSLYAAGRSFRKYLSYNNKLTHNQKLEREKGEEDQRWKDLCSGREEGK
ncbi:MAG: hypothetical protein KKD18_02945 [Nanoarchaeota archaeon]|nr:hypothetical protein [Nanoarchaeota archaeon]MBU0977347.1 hypothetical protein [Nanoarchaeota archaeon]